MALSRSGPWTASAVVLVGVLAAWTAWTRLGAVARGTAWAEDGGLFLRERIAFGPVDTLLRPYAGYLHLGPRSVVDAALLFPVDRYALAVSAICCCLVGAVCAGVFVLARDAVPSWPLRLVLAAVPVLLPAAPWEVSGTAANLHTFGLFLAPWLFGYRVRTWVGAVALAAVTVLVVGTEAQAVLFLPLLVLSWLPSPTGSVAPAAAGGPVTPGRPGSPDQLGTPGRRGTSGRLLALPVTVAAVVTGAAQVVTALTTERESERGDPTARDVLSGWLLQTVGGLWRADVASVGRAVLDRGWSVVALPAVGIALVVVIAVVLAAVTRRRRAAVLAAALAVGSAATWTAALVANASADGHWSRSGPGSLVDATPSRYAAAAGLLLTAALVVAASVLVDGHVLRSRVSGRTGGAARVVLAATGWCVVALVVTSWVANLPGVAQRSVGPAWQPQFADAEARCRADPDAVLRVRALPWDAHVPCALVLRDR
ncbi:hypothetical protein [Curtobacterium sp. MCBD17_008]|uniref:hypothetical protein n=1 Tax=Curtobacterium sp. MCBD17_008 TaxID=2175656 RepID=UPI000DA8D61D|nr:hypothetical protein [Curtobacterium sp. MCBD17_008]PZE89506.1 hypothetical protein DEI95_13990 [Curtobacterium sp. MCBD17_008]